MAYASGNCPHCGIKFNYVQSSVGTVKRCEACGQKFIVPEVPSVGCGAMLVAILVAIGGVGVLIVAACAGLAYLASRAKPIAAVPPAPVAKQTWKANNFQDAAIDPSSRAQKTQDARQGLIDTIFLNVSRQDKVVSATIRNEARDGWYSDDVARRNFAGMVYAFHFSDDSGTVNILDDGKHVGTYRWSNGPQYSDVTSVAGTTKTSKAPSDSSYTEVPKTAQPTEVPSPASNPPVATVESPAKGDEPMTPTASDVRTWRDASGKFKTEARWGGLAAGVVTLHKTDGTTVKIPLEQLSDEDREWIEAKRKSKR